MTATTTAPRSRPGTVLRLASAGAQLLAALVLVQAFLAGRYLFGAWTITVHGVIGNVVFALAVVVAGAYTFGRARPSTIVEAWVLVALVTAQIGLGYSSRTSVDAAAWHIPLGVAAFGLVIHLATRPAVAPEARPS